MNLAQLKAAQTAAGTRYTAALTELFAAYNDLAALDKTIANNRVGGGDLRSFGFSMNAEKMTLTAHPLVPVGMYSYPVAQVVIDAAMNAYLAGFSP